MRNATYTLLRSLVVIIFLITSCDSYEDVSPNTQFKEELLLGSWELDHASYEGVNVTGLFNDYDTNELLRITFLEDNSWVSENGNVVFSDAGSWSLSDEVEDEITIDDTTMNFEFSFDGVILTLTFQLDGVGVGGRVSGLSGEYNLRLSRIES